MGIGLDARDWWALRRQDETVQHNMPNANHSAQERANQCSDDGVKAGAKAAAIACVASAIPVVMGGRTIPWERTNLNYAAQAHIISLVSGAAYFIVADRTILTSARKTPLEAWTPM